MACPQPVMDQEVRFLRLLARIARFEIAAVGALRLLADDGQAIVARRQ
jgi:heat shock protein HslJ